MAYNSDMTNVIASLIGFVSIAVALAWMGLQAVKGAVGLGSLALFCQAFYQGQRMMRWLLGSAGEIYRNVMFLENLFEFLSLEPRISSSEKPLPYPGLHKETALQDVTFSYPGTSRPALEGFNLHIPAGHITALVGENGAGKSTLIKLICRFYDPEKGHVLMNGVDIRALSLAALRKRITVLFQDPVRYHDTAFNNIAFGDVDNNPMMDEVVAAARSAGADAPINRLPGAQTVLPLGWRVSLPPEVERFIVEVH
jgi:ATP-binding cassette, subfamily B, bacterial